MGEVAFPWLERYLQDFHLSINDLAGRVILDLGSGVPNFSRDCLRAQIPCFLVSLDKGNWYIFQDWQYRKYKADKQELSKDEIVITGQAYSRFVFAEAEFLPFRSEIFDLVLSHSALTVSLTPESFLQATRELDRVLGALGEVRLVPWHQGHTEIIAAIAAQTHFFVTQETIHTNSAIKGNPLSHEMLILRKP